MRVHVASDVHGESEALAKAADGADLFICLGDLLLYLDYDDPGRGAFAEVFGEDIARRYIELRLQKRFDEARQLTSDAWERMGGDSDPAARMRLFSSLIERQYTQIFAAMPVPSVFTFGNVDVPALGKNFIRDGQQYVDGGTVEIGGIRFGLVGAGLYSPYRTPNEISVEQYAEKLAALGEVDVLCTHIPPAVAELTFDVVARRFEVGSTAIREYIEEFQPRYSLFGHVHQPLAKRFRIGRTECCNVGHFRSVKVPFKFDIGG